VKLGAWRDAWLADLEGTVSRVTLRNYTAAVAGCVAIVGPDKLLEDLRAADLSKLRTALVRADAAPATISSKLSLLRRMIDEAVLEGHLIANPWAVRLTSRRTKEARRAARSTVDRMPLRAAELEALLEVCRNPKSDTPERAGAGYPSTTPPPKSKRTGFEVAEFPATEALILTGLRFGEIAGLVWGDLYWGRDRIEIVRALERYGTASLDSPTKTGAEWSIPIRPPLRKLLERQSGRLLEETDELPATSWVFPSATGGPLRYANWYSRTWRRALERARVTPSGSGNAQKLLRKAFITNSLICGRNPSRIASEVGHASLRMLTDHYQIWFDESHFPAPAEIERLRLVYGFEVET
jgi:integrase